MKHYNKYSLLFCLAEMYIKLCNLLYSSVMLVTLYAWCCSGLQFEVVLAKILTYTVTNTSLFNTKLTIDNL